MQDRVGIEQLIRDGLSWSVVATPRTPERKAFDEAVKKWESQRKEQGNAELEADKQRAKPMSRRIRAFVAWK